MDCGQVAKNYRAYLLGKLPPQEREAVADHIQDCADCFVMDRNENGPHLLEPSARKWDGKE